MVAGVIRGAFVAERWLPATAENFLERTPIPARYGFDGHPAPPEIIEHYAFKRVPLEFRKRGMANPVKYAGG